MNKNTIIGLVLIGAILFGFSWWGNTQKEESMAVARKEQVLRDSIAALNAPRISAEEMLRSAIAKDSLESIRSAQALGKLAPMAHGEESFTILENDLAIYTFSNKGGRIASVQLKDYKRLNEANLGDDLLLFTDDGSSFGFEFFAPEKVSTAELYFEVNKISDSQISYRLVADSATYVEYVYTLPQDNYLIDFKADFSKFRSMMLATQPDIALKWNIISPKEEKGFTNENNYTTIAYKFPGASGDFDELEISTGSASENITTKVQWMAFKQQFFSSIIIYDNSFSSANMSYNTFPESANNIKDFSAALTLPYSVSEDSYDIKFYFGPNKYSTLEAYGDNYDFQKLMPLGWGVFGWVNKWIVIPVFDFLGKYITNYGIIILLLTIFIKLIIFPLTYKSYLSTAKMRLLAPEIKGINERFTKKDEAIKKQQAMMALYKSAGVSPMGGCWPMLLQMPFLFAMFKFFPSSIELRGESFLWATDLSSYDSILSLPFTIPFYGDHVSLFTILMAVSLFVTSKLNYAQQSSMQSNQMPGMKFMMLYLMPVMLLFLFNSFSSGLTYYYLLSNIITVGQTYAFRTMVSDDKLHAKMKATAKKPVKKSKWSERLEAMQKQQQQQKKK